MHPAPHLLFIPGAGVIKHCSSVVASKRFHIESLAARGRTVGFGTVRRRWTPKASSLDDSKRRSRSKYDNIPDFNERYIAELAWVERNYGPKSLLGKDIAKEAQKSILADDSRSRTNTPPATVANTGTKVSVNLTGYIKVRQRLLGDTLFVGALGLCATWAVGQMRDVASFAVGIFAAVVYVWLLSRSVDRMAESARQFGRGGGDPLQAARVALFAILIIGTARNVDQFSVVSVILGFLSYKVATLLPLLTGEAFQ